MVRQFKFLFVTSSLDSGGAERWVYNTLSAHGIPDNVHIDYYFFRDLQDDLLLPGYHQLGVETSFRNQNRFGRIGELVHLVKDLRGFIRERGPYQAIHINGTPLIFQLVVLWTARCCNVGVRVAHSHSSESSALGWFGSLLRAFLRKAVTRNATMLAACSAEAAKAKYGFSVIGSPKYRLLLNGIDLDRFRYSSVVRERTRAELGIPAESPVLLHIGRLEREKNQIFLLECFEAFRRGNAGARLILVGKGSLHEALLEEIERKDLKDSVVLLDNTDCPESLYCAADGFVLPSLHEGLSYVCIESLACGCPVVMSDRIPVEPWREKLVCRVSLERGPEEWAAEISACIAAGRLDCRDVISANGYNLNETSKEFFRYLADGDSNG